MLTQMESGLRKSYAVESTTADSGLAESDRNVVPRRLTAPRGLYGPWQSSGLVR